jgi:large subunit ribosomal protein L22
MSKKAKPSRRAGTEAIARVRQIRVSPRKLNLVAQMIRGMKVDQALVQLTFSSKRIANDVKKAVQSAIANAENNHNLNVDAMVISHAYVGKDFVMKRMHTRARGRGARIEKPFSNLTIVLKEAVEKA